MRILLVEDFRPYRTLVNSLLSGNPEVQVIAEAEDGVDAVAKAKQLRPDVVLIDIGLPKLNGLEAARRIRELNSSTKIVFLTQERSAEVVREAISVGASGYILKTRIDADLLAGLAAIRKHVPYVSSGLLEESVQAD